MSRSVPPMPYGDASLALPLVVGRYTVWEAFARGGVASVHLACRTGAGGFARTVAVKRLHPQHVRDQDFVAMFVDEARLSARIHHLNVASVHDVVRAGDELLLVMDYVHGVALAELLARSRASQLTVSCPIAVAVLLDVLDGLAAANSAKDDAGRHLGLVHRDVSPQNILVGADGVCRLVDFGIAKAEQRLQQTRNGKIKGKAAYLSPEQLLANEATPRSDVYAAAVVMWEVLVGRPLHAKKSPAATALSVLEETPPAVAALRPDAPLALCRALERALAKDPAERFEDAQAFAADLRRATSRASRAELSDWVERLFGKELAVRAAECARIEGAVIPSPPERSRLPAIRLGASVMILGAGLALFVRSRHEGPVKPPRTPAPSAMTTPPLPTEPLPFTVALPDARSDGGPVPAGPAADSAGLRDGGPRSVKTSKDARSKACHPPWHYVDGIKRIKPDCL